MDQFLIEPLEAIVKDVGECTGLFYRCKVNSFINSKGAYVYQERMVPLKRMSCPGCVHCGDLLDELNEVAFDKYMNGPVIEKIKDSGLYKLQITNISTDWESGIVDDWDIEFVLVEESDK